MVELVGLPYSPWSEKARWALEARRVPYTAVLYAPLLGELGLRRRSGNWSTRVSVPLLFDESGHAIADSLEIARWADRHGEGEPLFPPGTEVDVVRWVDFSERALDAGRAMSLHRMLEDDEALREMVPKALRGPLGPLGPMIAAGGIRRTLRKYGAGRLSLATHEANLDRALDELRAAVAGGSAEGAGPRTLLGRFTFADIAATQALGFIEPPKFGIRVGPASRRSFTDAARREKYADLIAWRDATYERYRPR